MSDDMSEEDVLRELGDRGLDVDMGDSDEGLFIPDGWVRIYSEDTSVVLSKGRTLQDAFKSLPGQY